MGDKKKIVCCEACNKEFEKFRRFNGRHYCSRKCGSRAGAHQSKQCVICKTPFVSNAGNQKCYSDECVKQWGIIKTKRNYECKRSTSRAIGSCKQCKRTFDYHYRPDRGQRTFCSRSCASKYYILTDVYRDWQVNGKRSKFELEIEKELQRLYNNVQNTVKVNGWNIDIYVVDINVYVQADGVFWHGLDRSLNEIMKFKHEIDHDIIKNYERDIEQNSWFHKQEKMLLRITDVEWQKARNKQAFLIDRITRVLNG